MTVLELITQLQSLNPESIVALHIVDGDDSEERDIESAEQTDIDIVHIWAGEVTGTN